VISRVIRVLSTGGTFEKVYHPIAEGMQFDGTSAVPAILKSVGADHVAFSQVVLMDSLLMEARHRRLIVDAIEQSTEEGVVVVHGTSTMADSARYVADFRIRKAVVFTGALFPARVLSTEAAFNLAYAMMAATSLGHGVYVAMNGRVLDPRLTEKDPVTGHFSEQRF
jgi:L-asparaginase